MTKFLLYPITFCKANPTALLGSTAYYANNKYPAVEQLDMQLPTLFIKN